MLRSLTYKGIPVWRHVQVIQWTTQIVSGVLVVALIAWFLTNVGNAIQDREIPHGFGFLDISYTAGIGHSFLPYGESETFRYALAAAFTNTLIVSVVGVVLATALGIVLGIARLSGNWIVSKAAVVYIEFFRNVPLLLQLIFWLYILLALPEWDDSYAVADVLFLNKTFLSLPWLSVDGSGAALTWSLLAIVGIAVGVVTHRALSVREVRTGEDSHSLLGGFSAAISIGALAWVVIWAVAGSPPFAVSLPESPQPPFGDFSGGYRIPGGLIALVIGLVTYTAAFIAEIVRAGIQSVSRGQRESARALGLSGMTALRHVTFPQALRVIVPPLISQYLNLTKNSSLAGAIGYSDLTNVAKTMTQNAPAISIFIIIMVAYLALSLTYSVIGNLYNRHIRF